MVDATLEEILAKFEIVFDILDTKLIGQILYCCKIKMKYNKLVMSKIF